MTIEWIEFSEKKPWNSGSEYLILYYGGYEKGSPKWKPALWDDERQTFYDLPEDDYQLGQRDKTDYPAPDYWFTVHHEYYLKEQK